MKLPNWLFRRKNETKLSEAGKSVISIIEQLLTLQLILEYKKPSDALSVLRKNKLAAGYVFGFHDCCLRIFGLLDPDNPDDGLQLIAASYRYIFNDTSNALFRMSIKLQDDRDFSVGQLSGGDDYAGFQHKKIPPLGLQRILLGGFDTAAVLRGQPEFAAMLSVAKPRNNR